MLGRVIKMKISVNEFLRNLDNHINIDKDVFVIGISGGTASGKTVLSKRLYQKLKDSVLLGMDDYILEEEVAKSDNWDLPNIWDLDLIKDHLIKLKQGEIIQKPIYDFTTHLRKGEEEFHPKKIIIVEGLHALSEVLRDLLDLKIFVHADEEVRFNRRLKRDVAKRGRTEQEVREKWG